ncbi:MAG: squalene synthase HpnC [Acidocella sp.]|nr:squalene synthase HpnC [Acidocella sp.]
MTANDNAIIPIIAPQPAAVESWSGKDRADENFPVGSLFIRAALRPHIHAFYAFARNADDIADHAGLSPAAKRARLDIMEDILTGTSHDDATAPSAARLRASLAQTGISTIHARELLHAFRQDAVKSRYADWAELLEYCRYSAAPVGRYVLDLHGESTSTWPASDALCAALQILNHLQDCANDLRALDRCYIPADLLAAHNAGIDDIARAEAIPALRLVFDDMLARVATLNATAAALPGGVAARRLRVETAIIAALARRLTARLRIGDPLAARVALRKPDFIGATIGALSHLL